MASSPKRPATKIDLAELCRQHTPEAVSKILRIMKAKATPPGVALAAAVHILDRGYGRPRQEHVHRLDPKMLTDDELEYLIGVERRLSGIAGPAGGAGAAPVIEGSLADGSGRPDAGGEPGPL